MSDAEDWKPSETVPGPSARPPLAKTDREIRMEHVLFRAKEMIKEFANLTRKIQPLMKDKHRENLKKDLDDTAVAAEGFALECEAVLGKK